MDYLDGKSGTVQAQIEREYRAWKAGGITEQMKITKGKPAGEPADTAGTRIAETPASEDYKFLGMVEEAGDVGIDPIR